MAVKKELKGRPASAAARDLVMLHLSVPRPLRARLHTRAEAETIDHRLGLVVTSNALAVEILDEGLTRREKAAG